MLLPAEMLVEAAALLVLLKLSGRGALAEVLPAAGLEADEEDELLLLFSSPPPQAARHTMLMSHKARLKNLARGFVINTEINECSLLFLHKPCQHKELLLTCKGFIPARVGYTRSGGP